MKRFKLVIVVLALIIFALCLGKLTGEKGGRSMNQTIENFTKTPVEIKIVYDNNPYKQGLKTGWGFSSVIKTEENTVLFDTGGDFPTLLGNMEKMEIDPQKIDLVVLSHIHGDHTGGLNGFLDKNPNVTVYLPSSFPSNVKNQVKAKGADYVEVSDPMKITEEIGSTGELYGPPKEQSMFIYTPKGLVVITGCAHPGVVNIVNKTKKLTNESIYLVLGGFHLGGASNSKLKGIIQSFRDLGVKKAAPCHCSGDRCRELFSQEYGEDYIEVGVGKTINID